ncbi:MAG: CDP-diacylglycerol--serine O-phosphatidyltransferase [Gammaproteobacteria bacterium]|nr:CDP-diacylglycerol--serine O-phosphatidyltransferase [Gammaproteobacteria bacterium]
MAEHRRRGIYLLPNLLTTAALFCGFYAIVAAIHGRFEPAAVALFIAMILDGMDGRIARLTRTTSDFGVQYDSLSDMVSFGLAPALVVYQWSLSAWGKPGWLAAFIYAACAALRLARFNTQAGSADKRYFQGLPSPAAAAVIAGMVWFGDFATLRDQAGIVLLTFPLTVLAGVLMVSNIRYHSFKELDLHGRVPFVAVLIAMLILVLIAIEPSLILFGLALIYAVSGPVMTLGAVQRLRARSRKLPDESGGQGR